MADESRNESAEQQSQPSEGEVQQSADQGQQPAEQPQKPAEAAGGQEPSAEGEKPQETKPQAAAPEPAKSGGRGCSLFAWIVVLAVILAVAAYLVHRAQVEEQKRKQEELAQRRAVRESQVSAIGEDIAKALRVAQEGDIAKALMILEAQENLLATIAREASASGDNEDAQRIIEYKAAVGAVADAIRQKQEELRTFVIQQISGLGTKFPQVQRAATSVESQPSGGEKEQAAEKESGGEAGQPAAESGTGGEQGSEAAGAGKSGEEGGAAELGP